MPTRPEKKSETLEVRLGHGCKTAFMAQCRKDGTTASDAVRGFIEARVYSPGVRRPRPGLVHAVATAIAGLAIGAAAAPSMAQTANAGLSFERIDRNHDRVLTPAEFAAR